MIDQLAVDLPILALFLKFLIASTALLGGIWVLEKIGVINSPDISEMAWKAAIVASFVALLPISLSPAPIVIPISDGMVEATPATGREQAPPPPPAASFATATAVTNSNGVELTMSPSQMETATTGEGPQPQPRATPGMSETTGAGKESFVVPQIEAGTLFLVAWALLAAIALGTLGISYRRAVGSLGDRTRVPAEHHANRTLRALCETVDIRHVPYLSRSSAISSPVCLPRREICLPDWAFEDMDEASLDSLIAHELAHMVRKDPIMMIAVQTLCRVFFFQPLFALARRRLEDNAELAADEWAATHLSTARAVASALYTCAQKITEKRQTQWGLAMAGDKSILKQRVERLLAAEGASFTAAGRLRRWGLGSALVLAVVSFPGVEFATALTAGHPPEPADQPVAPLPAVAPLGEQTTRIVSDLRAEIAGHDKNHHIVNSDGNSGNLVHTHNGNSLSASWDGNFSFSDDERSIASLCRGCTLTIRTDYRGDEPRKVRFENEKDEMIVTYWVDGDRQPMDREGEKWLAETIEDLMQNTAIDMDGRVARYLEKGGTKLALSKLEDYETDYVQRIFVTHLVDQAELKTSDVKRLLDILDDMDSDYEIRLSAHALMSNGLINDDTLDEALDLADNIESDYEMRLLLSPLVSEFALNEKNMRQVLNAAKDIESDYEKRLLLSAAMSANEISRDNQRLVIDAARSIESDYELRLVISQFSSRTDLTSGTTRDLLGAIRSIEGDYEKRLALSAVVAEGRMDNANWMAAIDVAAGIEGDYEKRLALSQIKGDLPSDEKLEAAFREAAESIDGDYERSLLLGRRN